MIMGYLFFFLLSCPMSFFSDVSFCCAVCLGLFLDIYFLWENFEWQCVSMKSFSVCVFVVVYRKAIDFCKLILCPDTLMKLLTVSKFLEVLWYIFHDFMFNYDNMQVSLTFSQFFPYLLYPFNLILLLFCSS